MRNFTKVSLLLAALISGPLMACAQSPGARISSALEVLAVETHGDTTVIRSRIRTSPSSPERFYTLTLPLDAPPIGVTVDSGGRRWRAYGRLGRHVVAFWAYVSSTPFDSSPPLVLTTLGVPALRDAYMEGYHEPLEEGTPEADSAGADTTGYQYGARKIRMVGVGPRASSLSRDQLLARAADALDERCGAGATVRQGLCNSLMVKLNAARSALSRGDVTSAKGEIGAFSSELSAQRGKGVDETTYWLLSALAGLVTSRL